MKILKEGQIPQPVIWWVGKKYQCKHCGCQFEMEKGDHPNNDPIFTIPCPTCKTTLRVTRPVDSSYFKDYPSVFEDVFGNGGLFESVFGRYKTTEAKYECGSTPKV